MPSIVYERQLGPYTALRPGQWTDQTPSGNVALSCGTCGGIYEIPTTHRIEQSGFVVPAVKCEYATCSAFSYIRLQNYGDEVSR